MRAMSFALTKPQILARTKRVTRRIGWARLKPGEHFQAVEKAQGLKRGEKLATLAELVCVSNRQVRLADITAADCAAEGFPDLAPAQFVAMFCQAMRVEPGALVQRIEFSYADEPGPPPLVPGVIHTGDCLDALRGLPSKSVDLVFCSPPYEAARTYGVGFKLRGQGWVDWAVERYLECLRVSRGLVAWVVEGQTRQYRYSATPALLMADLHRMGVQLRKPAAFARVGIAGSGGPDFLRNDWEWVVCAGPGGRLPWSDNTAMGHPPKWAPGGEMSHRLTSGTRRNQWGSGKSGGRGRKADGTHNASGPGMAANSSVDAIADQATGELFDSGKPRPGYRPPKLANPGNIIRCVVGGGVMGSKLCHENEAPFPERLAEFFVRSFCPPGGLVLDPFAGSGTTLAVAERWERRWVGVELRPDQVALCWRRLKEERRPLAVS